MATVRRGEFRFDVHQAGDPDGEPVVLLHGFPQTATSWGPLTGPLVEAGYRTLAPDQRGYSPGARPTDRRAYRMAELVADALAVVDSAVADSAGTDSAGTGSAVAGSAVADSAGAGSARPGGPVHVVGHDWGAVVGWALAARHPERVRTLTSLSIPPPGALRQALRTPRQLAAFWYMLAFQPPGLVERLLRPAAGRPFSDRLVRALRGSGQGRAEAERDAAVMADPAALTAALNWYRAMPLEPRRPDPLVTAPVLFVWGARDTALLRTAAEAAPRHVAGPLRFVELPRGTHWIPERNASELGPLIVEHLAAHPIT